MSPYLPKIARNEGRKLIATTLNTVGLATFGLGFLTPLFNGTGLNAFKMALAVVILGVLHLIAQLVLQRLED